MENENSKSKNSKSIKKPINSKKFESLKVDSRTKALSKDKFLPPILSLTSTHFHHPIYYQTTATMLRQLNPNVAFKNQKMEENIDSLKQELSLNRKLINKKKYELNELRISISKLTEDNKNNKLLIAKVLNIELDKSFTKKELINTILNCKPTEEQKKELMEAYEFIKLKLKINDKKKILNENNNEINNLTKNATTKVLKELDNEYQSKCTYQKKILKTIKNMENNIKKNEKILSELEEEYNIQKEKNKKLMENFIQSENNMKEKEDEKNLLLKEITELKEKMRKIMEKITREKNKNKEDNDDRVINSLKKKVEDIKKYKENKEEIKKKLEDKKNLYKKLEEKKLEQEKNIEELNTKYNELSHKIDQYENEKNKLMKKINESKISSKKIKDLEDELKSIKKEKEINKNSSINNYIKESNNDINKTSKNNNLDLNDIKLEKNPQISETEKQEINKLDIEQLNQEINNLKNEIENVDNQISDNQNSINQYKKLIQEYNKTINETKENEVENT